tara:strand:- start:1488 stop:2087 length:600 start_codon:yes stop_codon:yes gene_type:complete
MIDEQIYRRFNHTVAACFVIYFLFPQEIFSLSRSLLIVLFWLIVITIEILRFQKRIEIIGLRDYEEKRVAGFVWFASGSCLLLGLYEMDLIPQSFVIGTIIMAAYTDPLIGESSKKWGEKIGIVSGLTCSFVIYQIIIGGYFYPLIGSVIAVAVEKPKIKWFDDDFAMQIFPILVMCILYSYGIGPDLINEGILIKEGI